MLNTLEAKVPVKTTIELFYALLDKFNSSKNKAPKLSFTMSSKSEDYNVFIHRKIKENHTQHLFTADTLDNLKSKLYQTLEAQEALPVNVFATQHYILFHNKDKGIYYLSNDNGKVAFDKII